MSDDTIYLELEMRQLTGKSVKQLREQGKTPAVVHDHGKESLIVQGPSLALRQVIHRAGKHHPIALTAGSRKYTVFIKEATYEPRKNQLSHVVFNAVSKRQKVETEVPVRPRYAEGDEASPAERSGLIVLAQLETVEVRAIADKIPDFLDYDGGTLMAVGDQVTVADLTVPDGVEILSDMDHPLATVYEPKAMEAANDAAGGDAEEESAGEISVEGSTPAESESVKDAPAADNEDQGK